jgi:hypothetical protein
MDKDEALKLARLALQNAIAARNGANPKKYLDLVVERKALIDIKEALAQPAQEPVTCAGVDFDIKTTPPQRPWVDLTDEEISSLSKGHMTRNGFARNVIAKFKEKNK